MLGECGWGLLFSECLLFFMILVLLLLNSVFTFEILVTWPAQFEESSLCVVLHFLCGICPLSTLGLDLISTHVPSGVQ